MREIKFRGKRIDNGEWVVGDYSRYSKEVSIIMVDLLEEEDYWVSNETVGQYTGLKDKNGVEIYEGDIVKCKNYHGEIEGDVDYGNSCFYIACSSGYSDEYLFNCFDLEVIGNIHDKADKG